MAVQVGSHSDVAVIDIDPVRRGEHSDNLFSGSPELRYYHLRYSSFEDYIQGEGQGVRWF